jgi:hypothetical protein
MNPELTWNVNMLWRGRRVLGWIGRSDSVENPWYGRTAGTKEVPFIRAEFEIEQAAKDFVMFLASTQENP